MSINQFLKNDLKRLVLEPEKKFKGNTTASVVSQKIPAQRSSSDALDFEAGGSSLAQGVHPNIRIEMLTVYSTFLVTEDGAFEKPDGWPNTGAYPGSSFELPTSTPYYEQRRVHFVAFEQFYDDGKGQITPINLVEERLYVPYAAPYEGKYGVGLYSFGGWGPTLKVAVNPIATSERVSKLLSAIYQLGIQNG